MANFLCVEGKGILFWFLQEGIESSGFLKGWIDSYPGVWFFRFFGVLALAVSIIMTVILIRKLTN